MLDFHSHILPGIDDGSRSVTESLRMLREEARQGVDEIVLTSHFYAWQKSPQEFLSRRAEAWNRLEPNLTSDLPHLTLGAEVQYFEGICHTEDITDLRAQGTTLLLLEMPFQKWSSRAIDDAIELNDRDDIQVVLAHIERYMKWQPKTVFSFMQKCGIMMQVNASFFQNWRTRHKALSMLRRGEIQAIGSDCHNMEGRAPNLGTVKPLISPYLDSLDSILTRHKVRSVDYVEE